MTVSASKACAHPPPPSDRNRCTPEVQPGVAGPLRQLGQSIRSSTVKPCSAMSRRMSTIACALSAFTSRSASAKNALALRINSWKRSSHNGVVVACRGEAAPLARSGARFLFDWKRVTTLGCILCALSQLSSFFGNKPVDNRTPCGARLHPAWAGCGLLNFSATAPAAIPGLAFGAASVAPSCCMRPCRTACPE